jgi:hypothetical protein
MNGADYVQWHGNYELLARWVDLKETAEELREGRSGDRESATSSGRSTSGGDGTGQ